MHTKNFCFKFLCTLSVILDRFWTPLTEKSRKLEGILEGTGQKMTDFANILNRSPEKQKPANPWYIRVCGSGAADRARTGMVLLPRDFKSLVSANSTTAACMHFCLSYHSDFFRVCQAKQTFFAYLAYLVLFQPQYSGINFIFAANFFLIFLKLVL